MEPVLHLLIAFARDVFTFSLALLTPVLAATLVALVVRIAQKYGLEVAAERQAWLEKTIQDLLLRVEEWAHYQQKLSGQPVTSSQKQVRFADLARALNLPPAVIVALRDQELPKVRALLGTTVQVSTESASVEIER